MRSGEAGLRFSGEPRCSISTSARSNTARMAANAFRCVSGVKAFSVDWMSRGEIVSTGLKWSGAQIVCRARFRIASLLGFLYARAASAR